jgi:hypothetical protein
MARGNALRILRQVSLGIVATALLVGTWIGRARTTSWQETLWVTIYPVVVAEQPASLEYLRGLTSTDFVPMADFVKQEASRYGIGLERPIRIDLGEPTGEPPAPPQTPNPLSVIAWSLRLQWWAWRELADQPGPTPDIRIFAVYHDPVDGVALPHSVGLQEGRIGIAHLFASRRMRGSNQVVLVHELLHTLGATDKYDPASNLPLFPSGYAEPGRQPLYPQRYAEIMGGRIPIAPDRVEIPPNLSRTHIGPATAAELRWIDPPR